MALRSAMVVLLVLLVLAEEKKMVPAEVEMALVGVAMQAQGLVLVDYLLGCYPLVSF